MGLLCTALTLYTYILIIRIILSWVSMAWTPPPSMAPVVNVIHDLTEPVLGFVRRYLPAMGGFDFSPLIVFFAISALSRSIC